MTVRPVTKIEHLDSLDRLYEQRVPLAWADAEAALRRAEERAEAEARRAGADREDLVSKYPSLREGR